MDAHIKAFWTAVANAQDLLDCSVSNRDELEAYVIATYGKGAFIAAYR